MSLDPKLLQNLIKILPARQQETALRLNETNLEISPSFEAKPSLVSIGERYEWELHYNTNYSFEPWNITGHNFIQLSNIASKLAQGLISLSNPASSAGLLITEVENRMEIARNPNNQGEMLREYFEYEDWPGIEEHWKAASGPNWFRDFGGNQHERSFSDPNLIRGVGIEQLFALSNLLAALSRRAGELKLPPNAGRVKPISCAIRNLFSQIGDLTISTGRPKSHTIPIARTIHQWVTKETNMGSDWGIRPYDVWNASHKKTGATKK